MLFNMNFKFSKIINRPFFVAESLIFIAVAGIFIWLIITMQQSFNRDFSLAREVENQLGSFEVSGAEYFKENTSYSNICKKEFSTKIDELLKNESIVDINCSSNKDKWIICSEISNSPKAVDEFKFTYSYCIDSLGNKMKVDKDICKEVILNTNPRFSCQ